jgi:hypothetical protein
MDKSSIIIFCLCFTLISSSLIMFAIIPYAPIAIARSSSPVENETAPSGIDWNTLCTDVSQMNILLQPCSDLVNSNGTLTSEGNTTMSCISSGLSLGLEALHQGMPLSKVIFGLGLLAQPTGCGAWINLNSVDSASQFQFLTQAFNLH